MAYKASKQGKDLSLAEEDELLECVKKDIERAKDHCSYWRDRAHREEQFYAGDQWDEDDLQKLSEEQRPTIVFNRIVKIINAVSGMELENRQEVSFVPTEPLKQTNFSDKLTQAVHWARSSCDAEDEESQSFQDLVKVGMGWTETRVDFEQDLDGKIFIDRVSPFEMLWDPNAKKRNLVDATFMARIVKYDEKTFKEMWPDIDPVRGDIWQGFDAPENNASQELHYKYKSDNDSSQDTQEPISVVQYQYYIRELVYRYQDLDGVEKLATEEQFKKIKPLVGDYVKQYRRIYRQCIVNGDNLLEYGDAPIQAFSFNCMTGFHDQSKNNWFGLIRLLKDPQMWSNKWLSQFLHILNSNAKGGLMVEEGAFLNPDKAIADWSKPNSITRLNAGGLQKVQAKQSPQMPAGFEQLFRYSIEAIQDVTGVNAEIMGLADREQSGVLENSRKQSAYSQVKIFFDSLRHYRKMNGRCTADFIKEYIAKGSGNSPRLIRVLGEGAEDFIPLIRDEMSFKYEVVVSDSPAGPNQKDKIAMLIMNMVPLMLQVGMPVPPEILDYLPLPLPLIEKWKEVLIQSKEDPQAEEKQRIEMIKTELNLEKQSLQNEELKSDITLNETRAQKELALAADHYSQSQENMSDVLNPIVKTYEVQREQSRKDAEFILEEKRKRAELLIQETNNFLKGL